MVGVDRLAELIADLQDGIERGHRILEDDRYVVAAHPADRPLRQLEQVASLEDRLAADDLAGRLRNQPEKRHRADALARARLTDDPERLARIDVVRDAVHGLDDAV